MRVSKWKIGRTLTAAVALGVLPVLAWAAPPTGEIINAKEPTQRGGYDVRSTLRLGGPDAPDEQQFYEKYERVLVDADGAGNIYVLDGGNVRVQVFDADGRWLRSVGSEGEGPGEFKMPARLTVNATGHCAVFDMSAMRISIFDATGALVRDQIAGRPVRDLHLLDDGTLLCTLAMPGGQQVVAYDAHGDEVWDYGDGETQTGGPMINIENGADHMATRLCVTPDGQVLMTSKDEYWLRLIAEGEAKKTFKRPFERREFEFSEPRDGGEDEDGHDVRVVMIRRGGGDGDDSPGKVDVQAGDHGETMTFNGQDIHSMMPKFSPDLRGALAWRDGRIWALTAENEGDRIVVDEWGGDGEYVRRFALTREYDWFELGADGKLYAVAHDEDDYPIVHRLDVTTLE